jgi:hypothetical protein
MGSGGTAPPFLTSALHRGEWSVSSPDLFTPEERAPNAYCIGEWVAHRAGPDALEKRKSLSSAGNRTSAVQSVARRYTD